MTFAPDRAIALLGGEKRDRPLLYPFLLGFCARHTGRPMADIYRDAQTSFSAQLETQKAFGFDWGPVYGYASYGTWEFGGLIDMPDEKGRQAPAARVYPVQQEADLDYLIRPDARRAGSLPLAMRFSELQARAGLPITVTLAGVFTLAGNICSLETLCRWLIKTPSAAEMVLEAAQRHLIEVVGHWAQIFGPKNVIPQLWEPSASNDILSPAHFERFVLPRYNQLAERLLGIGIRHLFFHICGEQNKNLPLWSQIPCGDPGLVSFGPELSIGRVLEYFGENAILIGNISPTALLAGPESRVVELALEALEAGRQAPRGFMLSTGCEVPPATPGSHLMALSGAAVQGHP